MDPTVDAINRAIGGSPVDYATGNNFVPVESFPQGESYVAPAAAPVDPYAQWGGQGAYNNLVSGFNTQEQNVYGSAQDTAKNYGLGYGNNILDFLDSLKLQQQQINNRGVQADLAKRQGNQGIQDMVGRGIRSGGTMLANRNATDSSATEALARAYGDIGTRQLAGVGQQYGLAQNEIGQAQEQLGVSTRSGLRKFDTEKQQTINSIVLDARNKLAQLEASMADASLPDTIDINAAKERVRQDALSQLQAYDQQLSQGVAGVQPTSVEARRAEAARLASLGTPVDSPFNFTTQTPATFQNTGAAAPGLPLYTTPKPRREV